METKTEEPKLCIRCEKQTGVPGEEYKLPLCDSCRVAFKDFNILVEFLECLPKDHPERNWIISSQIAERQSIIVGCKPKGSAIKDRFEKEVANLYRIWHDKPMIVEEKLEIVQPIVYTNPTIVAAMS